MKNLFFSIFLLFSFVNFAQIKGLVQDGKNKEALVGAKIFLSTGEKAITNPLGNFVLKPSAYPVYLKVSMIGYISDSLKITKDTTLTFDLYSQVQEIKTVVVTAGRRNQDIEDVAVSMEIIRPELVNNKGLASLEQAVDQSPGVYSMDGQVSIRGGGGYAYGAGSRVMLVWNGVPMLAPDLGDAKWNSVPMEQASQIEILKGASSVLYGSGALNGIIAVTEKEPGPKGELKAKIQSGIYDDPRRKSMIWWDKNPTFHLADVYYGKSFKNIGFTIGANAYLDSGYRKGENEKRYRLNGSIYFKPTKFPKLKAGIGYNAQYQDVGVFVLWKNDTSGYEAMDNTLSRQKAIRISVDPYVKFYDKYNNRHNFKSRYYIVTTGNSKNVYNASFAEMYYLDYQFQRKVGEFTNFTAGYTNNTSRVISTVFSNHISQNSAAYTQFESAYKKLDFSVGMRLEYYKLDSLVSDSRFRITDSLSIPIYPVFRAGLHYEINKASHLRASIGQGVRFPSIGERYVSTSVGGLVIFRNPELKPETGWAAEIGYKQIVKFGDNWKGFFDVAGFVNQYSNMTEFTFGVYKPDTMGNLQVSDPNALNYFYNWVGFQAKNAEKARITGVELSFNSQGKIGQVELTSLIGYTYMNPISLNNDPNYRLTFSDTSSRMLKYRFNHLAKVDVQATYKKLSIGFSSRYNSYMKNIDAVFETGVLGQELLVGMKKYRDANQRGALVFDTRMSYEIKKEIKLNLIVNNLLNAEYVSRPGDIQAPRNFIVQLQFSL
ncbi:MAG: TonB-dependent receptor [Flavobacteriales bacterium]|nr:TonB-dependent receptor [Flavobacteriales bacterium]